MSSEVDICNFALMKLGHSAISSLIDDSDEARACNAAYALLRDELESNTPWNFATGWYPLALLVAAPADPNYTFAYQIPTNTLRVWSLDTPGWSYVVQGDQLWTDMSSPIAQLTKRVTDTGKFPPLFVTALAYRLAAEMCDSIVAKHTNAIDLTKLYEAKLQEARTADGQESSPQQENMNPLIYQRVITNTA